MFHNSYHQSTQLCEYIYIYIYIYIYGFHVCFLYKCVKDDQTYNIIKYHWKKKNYYYTYTLKLPQKVILRLLSPNRVSYHLLLTNNNSGTNTSISLTQWQNWYFQFLKKIKKE